MKKIFFSTWVLVMALFFLLSQGNTLLFGAEKMMDRGMTAKEKMETGNTMKKETGTMKEQETMKKQSEMMKEQDMMKKETGMIKEEETMKKETGMMRGQDTMKKETGMMKENK
jgi:hypothetical protein